MEAAVPFLIFSCAIGLIIFLAWIGAMQARKRRQALAAEAARLGLAFLPDKDTAYPPALAEINALHRGDDRYAYNILSGSYRGHSVHAFDYHYETTSTDSDGKTETTHHYMSCFILDHGMTFPELHISPEGFLSKVAQFLGFEDIDFESIEFSKAFIVRSKDRKFAYDVCHARMMEHLLARPGLALEFDGRYIALPQGSVVQPPEIQGWLDELIALRELLPEYLTEAAKEAPPR